MSRCFLWFGRLAQMLACLLAFPAHLISHSLRGTLRPSITPDHAKIVNLVSVHMPLDPSLIAWSPFGRCYVLLLVFLEASATVDLVSRGT